jgi:hypothetical protein
MKAITLILAVFSILSLNAQEKFSLGFQVEGILTSPKNNSNVSTIENSFGSGAGIYFTHGILKSFSLNTGLNYRFIQYNRFDKNVFYPIGYPTLDGFQYKQNYLVLPVNIRKSFLNEKLFIETGVELARILGRDKKDPQTELLWKIGAGSKIGKLSYSLNYIWGNREQFDVLRLEPDFKVVDYKSRMMQFKVSYPLFGKK